MTDVKYLLFVINMKNLKIKKLIKKKTTIENMLMKIKDLEKVNEDAKTLERKVYILEKKNIGNVFCEEEFEEKRPLVKFANTNFQAQRN